MNNIEFKHVDQYIHSYKVNGLHDFLLEYKLEFDQLWESLKEKNTQGIFNEGVLNPKINNVLQPLLLKITNDYYTVDPPFHPTYLGLYSQTKDECKSIYHNHYKQNTLSSTMYLNPPNPGEGGELSFMYSEVDIFNLLPQKDTIYFFPSWVMHKPLPQSKSEIRHCLNWGYNCSKRPIHKLTGDRW